MIKTDGLCARVRSLPRDVRGFPIPWFVTNGPDGQPRFAHVETGRHRLALQRKGCWICGQPLGGYQAFVTGPAGLLNRVATDPPAHLDCARDAVKICPFMVNPKMRRQPAPENLETPDGLDPKNPGISVVYVTRSFRALPQHGSLLELGEPTRVEWWKEGRPATRLEASEGLSAAVRALNPIAEKEGEGSMRHLLSATHRAIPFLPEEATPESANA